MGQLPLLLLLLLLLPPQFFSGGIVAPATLTADCRLRDKRAAAEEEVAETASCPPDMGLEACECVEELEEEEQLCEEL